MSIVHEKSPIHMVLSSAPQVKLLAYLAASRTDTIKQIYEK